MFKKNNLVPLVRSLTWKISQEVDQKSCPVFYLKHSFLFNDCKSGMDWCSPWLH